MVGHCISKVVIIEKDSCIHSARKTLKYILLGLVVQIYLEVWMIYQLQAAETSGYLSVRRSKVPRREKVEGWMGECDLNLYPNKIDL